MIDVERIKRRAEEIRGCLEKIRRYIEVPNFWEDERNILSVKLLLLQTIEAAAAICSHIMAKKEKKAVSSFSECFELMGEKGIIEKALSDRLKRAVRFRNILIHKYWEVEDRKVVDYARSNLSDFEQFLQEILKNIK